MGSTSSSLLQELEISPKPVYETLEYDLYDAHDGRKKLSLFQFKITSDPDLIDFSAWKSIRHPLIVQYLEHGVVRGKTFVLTEFVEPVSRIISSLESEEVLSGMSDILKALDFLHIRCRLSHNNVNPKSLFFSRKALCWKLGCTQLMSSPDEETFDFVKRMVLYKRLNGSHEFLPPEDLTPQICQPIPSVKEIHRRDSFAAGRLMESLLPHLKDCDMVHKMTAMDKDMRPEIGLLLKNEPLFTQSPFLLLKESLLSFGSFTEDEKKTFLTGNVIVMMTKIPEKLLASTVIPIMLTNRLLMLHPESRSLLHPHLFVPDDCDHDSVSKHLISSHLFQRNVVPVIVKLFSVRKVKLRLILLQYLPFYAHLIGAQVMSGTVCPLISLALEDENDDLLSATFAALSVTVRMFGGDIVQDPKSKKKRRKIFSNDVPRSSISFSSSSHAALPFSEVRDSSEIRHYTDSNSAQHNRLERKEDRNVASDGTADDWQGEWESTASSSPPIVTQVEFDPRVIANGQADDVLVTENGHHESSHQTNAISCVPTERTIKSWKKRTGVTELDIKAIEIQESEEVQDIFSEMEPRVHFAARVTSHGPGSRPRVNSHSKNPESKKDMFALKVDDVDDDGSHDDVDDGDWHSDDDDNDREDGVDNRWTGDQKESKREHDMKGEELQTGTASAPELS